MRFFMLLYVLEIAGACVFFCCETVPQKNDPVCLCGDVFAPLDSNAVYQMATASGIPCQEIAESYWVFPAQQILLSNLGDTSANGQRRMDFLVRFSYVDSKFIEERRTVRFHVTGDVQSGWPFSKFSGFYSIFNGQTERLCLVIKKDDPNRGFVFYRQNNGGQKLVFSPYEIHSFPSGRSCATCIGD